MGWQRTDCEKAREQGGQGVERHTTREGQSRRTTIERYFLGKDNGEGDAKALKDVF